jgi:hypothetical protein
MRLVLSPESRVFIDLQAAGLLRAAGHDPTLSAAPEPLAVVVPDGEEGRFELPVEARVRADTIEPPTDISPGDREQMRANMLGREVLDAARFPTLEFRGRYAGTFASGTLAGDLVVRGVAQRVALDLRTTRDGSTVVATGAWEGHLTELGIKPYKALLGALKLKDWIRLRLSARFVAG